MTRKIITKYTSDIKNDPIGSEYYVEVKNISKFYKYRRNISTEKMVRIKK